METKYQRIHPMVCQLNGSRVLMDYTLPAVTLCGNPGSGKTRLIEALSGLYLASYQQAPTRCPVEFMFAGGSEFLCSVSLYVWHDDILNRSVKEAKELPFQKDIRDPSLVGRAVLCAQNALLNPNQDIQTFHNQFAEFNSDQLFEDQVNQLCYTRNSIIVRVFGSKHRLTLIDLPGSGDTADLPSEQVEFTEKLVAHYIKRPYMLVLVTVACLDAIQPLRIFTLVSQFDPKGQRTLCVLTKPDTIGLNHTDTWFRALRDQPFQPQLGFHIIRNPDDFQVKFAINHQDAHNLEVDFFKNTRPWSHSNLTMRSRLGVDNLRAFLYSQLDLMTVASLPDLQLKIGRSLKSIKDQIASFPDPNAVLFQSIKNFSEHFKAELSGNTESSTFQQLDGFYQEFNQTLNHYRPVLLLPNLAPSTNSPSPSQPLENKLGCDEEMLGYYVHFDTTKLANWFPPYKLQALSDSIPENPSPQPGEWELTRRIVRECQVNWLNASQICLNRVTSSIQTLANQLLDVHFGESKLVLAPLNLYFQQLVMENYRKVSNSILSLVTFELETVATWHPKLEQLVLNIIKLLDTPLLGRTVGLVPSQTDPFLNQLTNLLNEYNLNLNYLNTPRLASNLTTPTLLSLANAQAYYHIAHHRFGDAIPILITRSFLYPLITSLDSRLFDLVPHLDPSHLANLNSQVKPTQLKLAHLNSIVTKLEHLQKVSLTQ